jgi:hypothetical protein
MSGDAVAMLGPGGGWRHPDCTSHADDHRRWHCDETSVPEGQLEPQELLDLTISVDHDIVDGVPAARFARRLAELVEAAEGLDTVSWAGHESEALGAG